MLEVNLRLNGSRTIVGHDVLCVRVAHAIDAQVKFCYLQNHASPKYSTQFVDWLVEQHTQSATFFSDAKIAADMIRKTKTAKEK